jgi:hypothetical protein
MAEFDSDPRPAQRPQPLTPLPAPPARRAAVAPPAPDGALLLYRLVTSWQRRVAWVLAIVTLLFAAACLWSALRAVELNGQAAAVEDVALVDRFGIRIPDPRPAIERAELRVRATAYSGLAIGTGLAASVTLLGVLLVRPPGGGDQPPI